MNNKIYFIATLCGVLAFAAIYHNFDQGYEARLEAVRRQAADEQKAAAARNDAARSKAMQDAVVAQERRKKEQLDSEHQEEARKIARQEAEDTRAAAFENRRRLRDQADRLKKDVDALTADMAKASDQKKALEQEKAFLLEAVAQANANVRSFQELLDKIDSAEKARTSTRTAQN